MTWKMTRQATGRPWRTPCAWFNRLLLSAVLVAAPAIAGGQADARLGEVTVDLEMPFPDDPENIGNILQLIEENAIDIRDSADRLIAFTEQPGAHSWLTHNWRLNRIQESLAEMNVALSRFESGTNLLLDGQKAALDVIRPAAEELNRNVAELAALVEQYPDWDMQYVDLAESVRDPADTIVNAAALAESLAEVRTYLDELESKD